MKQYHGAPALLSLLVPGLGQLVKRQWKRAAGIWALIAVPPVAWAAKTAAFEFESAYTPALKDVIGLMKESPLWPLLLLYVAVVWVWSIVDAYRRPASGPPFYVQRPSMRSFASSLIGMAAGAVYGLIIRMVFGDQGADTLLSLSFFLLAPFALGIVTVLLGTERQRSSWVYVVFAPWISCTVCVLIAVALAFEALFCILIALPLFWLLATLGGVVARVLWARQESRGQMAGALILFAAMPYMVVPVESLLPVREAMRRVHSQIEIAAPPDVVWGNITSLREIQAAERPFAFFRVLGLPRPIQARMACERVGCVRRGQWDDGRAFDGTITMIEPGRTYWVSLVADLRQVRPSPAPLSQIGGPVFGMVDDGYEIVPLDGGRTALHLYSTYRVKTRINPYAILWLDFLMRDIQRHILIVEKSRSERQVR